MSNINSRAANAYRTTQVKSRSELELVVLLYDGLVRYLTDARNALVKRDLHAKRTAVARAMAILGHLQNTLDHQNGGEIAAQLQALYIYITGRVIDGNLRGEIDALDEALNLIAPLREAWSDIASKAAAKVTA
jgi:flagellar protein FliS